MQLKNNHNTWEWIGGWESSPVLGPNGNIITLDFYPSHFILSQETVTFCLHIRYFIKKYKNKSAIIFKGVGRSWCFRACVSHYWYVEWKVACQSFMQAVITNHIEVYLCKQQHGFKLFAQIRTNQTITMAQNKKWKIAYTCYTTK